MYRMIRSGRLEQHYQIEPKDSWLVAACERDLPIIVPQVRAAFKRTDRRLVVDIGGGTISAPMSSVVRIEQRMSPLQEYRQRAAAISDGDAEAWRALATDSSALLPHGLFGSLVAFES